MLPSNSMSLNKWQGACKRPSVILLAVSSLVSSFHSSAHHSYSFGYYYF